MKRKIALSIMLGAVVALVAASIPAGAAPAPKTVIEDPLGDANFVNDQGTGDGTFGDQTAADAGTVSDLVKIDMSNDAKNLYVNILTEAGPPAATGIGYRVRVNPDGAGGTYCLRIEAYYSGANNVVTSPVAWLFDDCTGADPVSLTPLGTYLVVPRNSNPAFAKGSTLTAPQAQSFLYSGDGTNGFSGPIADTTLVGTDYKFVDKKKK